MTVGRIIVCGAHAVKTPLSSYTVKLSANQDMFLLKILGTRLCLTFQLRVQSIISVVMILREVHVLWILLLCRILHFQSETQCLWSPSAVTPFPGPYVLRKPFVGLKLL